MDTRKLEAFIRAVDLGSISGAATSLHTSQSALSQQLSNLESQIGVQLMKRTKTGIEPTSSGRTLYRRAQHILEEVDNSLAEVRNVAKEFRGKVSVAFPSCSIAPRLTLELLQGLRKEAPGLVLHIQENLGDNLLPAIASAQVDIGLLYTPVSLRAVSVEPVLEDRLVLATPQGEGVQGPVDVRDLTDRELYLPSRDHSVRRTIDSAFYQRNVFPSIAGEIDSVHTLLEVVGGGLGSTIMPRSAFPGAQVASGVSLHELGEHMPPLSLALCTARDYSLSETANVVRMFIVERLASMFRESDR